MVCEKCSPAPGKLITVDNIKDPHCSACGRSLLEHEQKTNKKWDQYFHSICESVAGKSPCLSRKIGAILVRDHSIVSTGYNGPPRGIPHCGPNRNKIDKELINHAFLTEKDDRLICPRKAFGYKSGTHMELCPAQHAEENAVSNAARNGVSVLGCTLYMNAPIPCKNCYGTLINAGIVEIVISHAKVYDKWTTFLIDNSTIKIREFEL